MTDVQLGVRSRIARGRILHTPTHRRPFTVQTIDTDGVVLLLGRGEWPIRLSWECLKGVVPFLAAQGSAPIGGRHEVEGNPGTLDEYLKAHVRTNTAGYIAVLLEEAGVVEVIRERPAKVRLTASTGSTDPRRGVG